MAEAKAKATAAVAAEKKVTPKQNPILKDLLQSGAHFGHRSSRWNPKMASYIFGDRGGVHIIDLAQTAEKLEAAEKFAYSVTKSGGQILFVGTKRQARPIIEKAALEAGMPFVTYRWLGGMLTNLDTINSRILRMKKLETQKAENDFSGMIKKEKGILEEEMTKLGKVFNGVRDMYGVPAAVFVVDMPKEDIAIAEARKLSIPVIAIADTNADPDQADYLIPANDDAIKTITLITQKIADAAQKGMAEYKAKAQAEESNTEDDK